MKYITTSLIIFLTVISGTSEDDREFLLRKYMEKSGQNEHAKTFFSHQIEQKKSEYPNVPGYVWEELNDTLMVRNALDKRLADIYLQTFNIEEIKELLAFCQSPTFRKMQELDRAIAREAVKAGVELSDKISKQIDNELLKRGYSPGNDGSSNSFLTNFDPAWIEYSVLHDFASSILLNSELINSDLFLPSMSKKKVKKLYDIVAIPQKRAGKLKSIIVLPSSGPEEETETLKQEIIAEYEKGSRRFSIVLAKDGETYKISDIAERRANKGS